MKTRYKTGILILAMCIVILAYDDLSNKKVATQSTTWPVSYDTYKASNAVDGNITTCMRSDRFGSSSPDTAVWWKVDLGGVYNIYSVNILFKNYDGYETRQRGRFAGFSLYVSNTGDKDGSSVCYKDGPQLPPLNFTTTCLTSGRYVMFHNERLEGITYPSGYEVSGVVLAELCEVFVLGCARAGVFGSNCDVPCPDNCRYNTCHILNGTCFGCPPGWTGRLCNQKCPDRWYGQDCKYQCSGNCRDNALCNHVTGRCDGGCAAGWRGVLCDETCNEGYFGTNCFEICHPNCKTCHHTDGKCGCHAGWMGSDCKTGCVWSFGEDCRYPCNTHCVNQSCDRFNGSCLFGCDELSEGDKCDQVIIPETFTPRPSPSLQSQPWSIIGPVLLGFNILFIICVVICLGLVHTKKVSTRLTKRFNMKTDHYIDAIATTDYTSYYQDIDKSGDEPHNTISP